MTGGSYIIRNFSADDRDKYFQLHFESEQLDPSGYLVSVPGLSNYLGRPKFSPQKDLFVAERNGVLIGCAGVTLEHGIQRALLDGLVHPLHRRRGVATKLISRAMQRISEANIKRAQVSVFETDAAAKNLLIKLDFQFIRHFFEMRLEMNSTRLPSATKSETISRRLRQGEEDLLTEIQNRCFADTWGFNPNTEEEIAYRLYMHGRSPDDVILTYLGDLPVGYCWTNIDAEANARRKKSKGLIHMLGVDPDYRHREIGKAILLNGLEDLKARGIDIVELTVDSENAAACSLYESMGFAVYARTEWYEKRVKIN